MHLTWFVHECTIIKDGDTDNNNDDDGDGDTMLIQSVVSVHAYSSFFRGKR